MKNVVDTIFNDMGISLPRFVNVIIALAMLPSIFSTSDSLKPYFALAESYELNNIIYLPIVRNAYNEPAKMVGIIADGFWVKYNNDLETKIKALDAWAGKKHTMVGWYYDFVTETNSEEQVEYNFRGQLENLWVNGYVSYVKIGANGAQAWEIGAGHFDQKIRFLAKQYALWANKGGGRRAFLAPLQEMNGYWVTYGKDATNFKIAYDRIRSIFAIEGVTLEQVWWTFSPNGWSEDGFEFEKFYPGDAKVDVVAFSGYNFGYCPVGNRVLVWDEYQVVFKPYLDRMVAMAPTKPIIVSETSTSGQYPQPGNYSQNQKNQWLIDSYNYLVSQPNVIGVFYFDLDGEASGECDYEIFNGPRQYSGYRIAIGNPLWYYYEPSTLSHMNLMGTP